MQSENPGEPKHKDIKSYRHVGEHTSQLAGAPAGLSRNNLNEKKRLQWEGENIKDTNH